MTVNYSDLIKADFVLKVGDELLIHGLKYKVTDSETKFWLENIKGTNNAEVFIKLGRNEDRMKWANEYDDTISQTCPFSFPEFSSLEKLTSFVQAIYETPGYKVGTKVRVKERKGRNEDYPCYFCDDMERMKGRVFTIKDVRFNEDTLEYEECKYYDGDINIYKFQECPEWLWSSSMFELVSEEKIATCPSEEYIESLEKGDTVIVGGKECVVTGVEARHAYWITIEGGLERVIYDNLDITNKQKVALAKKYHATNLITTSPEFGSLEDLTDFVNALNSGEWKNLTNSDKEEKPKKDITYEDLVGGYILQEDDRLVLAGDKYRVECGNFLVSNEVKWDTIFYKVGVEDKDGFCEKFGELFCRDCIFPEFKTAEGLTKCVIELMERAEHILVSPEPFAVSMDYGSGSSTPIAVISEPRPSFTTDTGIVRLPEIKDDFKIIIL